MGTTAQLAPEQNLPTFDELLAKPEGQPTGGGAQPPTFDELLAKPDTESSPVMKTLRMFKPLPLFPSAEDIQQSNATTSEFLKHTAVGRILDAVGHGAADNFGDEHVGLSADSQQKLADAGILPDLVKGQSNIARDINYAFITPAAVAADAFLRTGGAVIGAAQAGVTKLGEETGFPETGKFGAELINFAAQGAPGMQFAYTKMLPDRIPHTIAQARSNAVIGEGEAGYFGTREPTPQDIAQRDAVAFHMEQEALRAVPETVEKPSAAPEAPKTIHDIAREIEPDAFGEYDALEQERNRMAQWMRDVTAARQKEVETNAPQNAEIAELRTKVADAEARGKKTAYADILEKRETEREDHIEQEMARVTPDMENVRAAYNKLDYRMRDIADTGVLREAYSKAQERMPETETVEPAAPAAPAAPTPQEQPFTPTEGHFGEFKEEEGKAAPQANLGGIRKDVSDKLVAAGRPAEEADAAASLVAEHYNSRSQRFGGMLGSAEEMYKRDGADIQKGKGEGKTRLGVFTPAGEAKATIKLMKSANASTFIHETGHHWLDELLRDAKHDLAPEQLKKDAKAARDWLGVGEDATLRERNNKGRYTYEKQHEKFARGFERYLMEGRAPSKELAGVFAKFKDWLTRIYQTVSNLKSPITDDIRQVFDRLLAAKPGKTVVAPEAETAPLDTRGVEENAVTPPTTQPSAAPVPAAAPEASPTKAVKPQETSKEESTKIADPNKPVAKEKTDLVDKAGNIRLENLTDNEDVKEVLRQLAAQNNDFNGARRGTVTDAEVADYAQAMGVEAREVNLKRLRQMSLEDGIPLAARIRAGRQMLVQSSRKVAEMMANTSKGIEDDIAFAMARERHLMIAETIAAVTAETGRALRAFQDISGESIKDAKAVTEFLQRETGLSLSQLQSMKKVGASLDTPAKIAKFMQDSTKPSFGDQVLEYWTNGLVSGPATHTTYAIGNALLAVWRAVPETLVASALGKTVKAGESWARVKAMITSLPTSLSAAGKALRTGTTTLLPGEELRGLPFQGGRVNRLAAVIGNKDVNWHQLGSDAFGAVKGMRDAFVATAELMKNGGVEDAPLMKFQRDPFRAVPDIRVKGINALPLGTIVNVSYRSIAGIHSFFRTANYSMEKAALAYRAASEDGLEANAFNARVADIVVNPTAEIMTEARKNATDLTLMGQGGALTKAMSHLTNTRVWGFKPFRFIDPFVHISSNIIEQSLLHRTPLGILSEDIHADLMGKNGLAARDYARARMIVGSATGVTIGMLASQGLISGSGPSDPKQAALWRLNGNQPHSVRIGDAWYDIHRLGPLGLLASVAADMHDFAHALGEEDMGKLGGMFVHSVAHNILDESFMRGPSDLIKAVTDHDRYGEQYVRNFISSFVPFSVGMSQVARAVDPYSRQTRSVADAIVAKLPWESETLAPKYDIWGQPVPTKEVLGVGGLSAIYVTRISHDPVNQALLKLGYYPGKPERKIRGVVLTDTQYDEYQQLSGSTMKMRLDAVVGVPGFTDIPAEAQLDVIHKIVSKSRDTARTVIMMRHPDIIKEANEAKILAISGGKTPSQDRH